MRTVLSEPLRQGPIVPRSKELISFLQARIGFLKHEQLIALYVDQALRLLRIRRIAEGGFDEVVLDTRKIIACGLGAGASAFILVHNHPSGVPTPSPDDIASTGRLKRIAAEMDLHLLDHLRVARGCFGSVSDFWREATWQQSQSNDGCPEGHPSTVRLGC